MSKKNSISMKTIGNLLLWCGIILLLGRGCAFVLSLGNAVSSPDYNTPFSYHLQTFQPNNQGSQTQWTFAA